TRVAGAPSIIRVEDVHWIDDASRDLLDELAMAAGTRPWLLCLTTVPDQPALPAPRQRLAIGPLDRASTRELAAAALGNSEVVDSAGLDLIATQSGGHPLFTIELAAAAVARGSVDTLPESVESAITSRMDTLRAEDRALVR